MSWTPATVIAELRDLDETARIEAKRGLGKSAHASVSAFANEPDLGGGWLVFGVVRDEDGHYDVVGVPDPDGLQAALTTKCRTLFNRVVRPDVRVDRVDGAVVVVAFVPESAPVDKPMYVKATGLPGGGWRRIGSTDQRLLDADLAELASLAQATPFDRRPQTQSTRADLDDDAIAVFRRHLRESRPTSELLALDTEALLQTVGALVLDRGVLVPSVAGLLLLGKKLALRRLLPSMRIDYIRIRGTTWSGDALESYTTIEVREALITGWRRVFAAIMDDLPTEFHLPPGQAQRRDLPAIPERVVREAVINALSHRSYEVHSAIQVRRYSDRIEIESPGHSLVPPEQWGTPVSKTRNPTLTDIFRDLDLAEKRGTGIRRMRERMAEANLAPPQFESDRAGGRFVTTFRLHHFLSDADLIWVKRFGALDLSSAEVRVLVHLRHRRRVSNPEVRELTGLDMHTVTLLFRGLVRRGAIVQNAKGRATFYTLAQATADDVQPDLFDGGTKSGPSRDQVEGPSRDQGEAPSEGPQSAPSQGTKSAPSQGTQSAPSRHPVEAPSQVQRAVLALLAEPKAPREIREALGRSDRTKFRESVLKPMLEAGWIEMTVPDKPRSRLQRYRRTAIGAAVLGEVGDA